MRYEYTPKQRGDPRVLQIGSDEPDDAYLGTLGGSEPLDAVPWGRGGCYEDG